MLWKKSLKPPSGERGKLRFLGSRGDKMKSKFLAAVSLMLLAGPALAQTGGQNVDWPLYLGDATGSKFKPLDQINASNFSNLEVAWRF